MLTNLQTMNTAETEVQQAPADGVVYSVIVPVYNSAGILPELHDRLSMVMHGLGESYEIIFVEDCGPDNAWHVLAGIAEHDAQVSAIQLMRNSGQGAATLCGLSWARGEFIITMDDDLQHPPEEVPVLVQALRGDDQLDVVMGVPREKRHNLARRLGSRFIHEVNSHLLHKDKSLRFTSFRVMRRPVVDGMLQLRTLYPALGPMINSITRRIRNVEVQHDLRPQGRSGYTFGRLMRQTMSNFIGYSMLPLRFLATAGAVGIVLSIAFAVVLVIRYLMGGITVPGWTSLALLLVIISGFNFFAFAVLGEYVLRILQLGNATPQYFVRGIARHSPGTCENGTSVGKS